MKATETVTSDPAGLDLGELDLDELEDELATLGGSCAVWIAWRCGLTPRSAREHVRVARRLPGLPQIRGAVGRGELSYAKVRALPRVATGENEAELLELAELCTAAQLERTVRAYRQLTCEEAREQQEDAYLSVFWQPDGILELPGRLAPEDGALLLRALEAQRDQLWRDRGGSADPRPARQASQARGARRGGGGSARDQLVQANHHLAKDADTYQAGSGDPLDLAAVIDDLLSTLAGAHV